MDHGFEIDSNKRCSATTQKLRPCTLFALRGIDMCALHSGLARAKGKPGYGDAKALAAYKRVLASPEQTKRPVAARP